MKRVLAFLLISIFIVACSNYNEIEESMGYRVDGAINKYYLYDVALNSKGDILEISERDYYSANDLLIETSEISIEYDSDGKAEKYTYTRYNNLTGELVESYTYEGDRALIGYEAANLILATVKANGVRIY